MLVEVKVALAAVQPATLEAWRAVFSDRPEVEIIEAELTAQPHDAWVTATKRGDLEDAVRAALGEPVERAVQALIRERFGGSLPADFAVGVPTGGTHPKHLVAASNTPRNPHGINDHMRVALAAGAALQAVHVQNAAEPGSIRDVVLPRLGPETVSERHRAELMWTAYELFRQAELPDGAATRRALCDLLGGAAVKEAAAGTLKRTYRKRKTAASGKSTMPDRPSARAPLESTSED